MTSNKSTMLKYVNVTFCGIAMLDITLSQLYVTTEWIKSVSAIIASVDICIRYAASPLSSNRLRETALQKERGEE